jgi:hypothetical protein
MDSRFNIPAPLNLNPQGRNDGEITPTDSGGGEATAEPIFLKELPRKAVVYAKVPVP